MSDMHSYERFEEELHSDGRIHHSVHCANCGYSLRLQRYTGRCPECGKEYNARPLHMRNIFQADSDPFPVFGVSVVVSWTALTVWMIVGALTSRNSGLLFFGLIFLVMCGFMGAVELRKVRKTLHAYRISRRVAESEDW